MRKIKVDWIWLAMMLFWLAVAVLLFCGCRTTHTESVRYVQKTDTVYRAKIRTDSIWSKDSIFVNQYIKGDTVYSDKFKLIYRYLYRNRTDTVYKAKTDTLYFDKEKVVTQKHTSIKSIVLSIVAGMFLCLVGIFIVKRYGGFE